MMGKKNQMLWIAAIAFFVWKKHQADKTAAAIAKVAGDHPILIG